MIIIEQAEIGDLAEFLLLQREAYKQEAEIYDDYTLPPLLETGEEMEAVFKTHIFLVARLEGRIVGSVRGYVNNGTGYIGRLIVAPEHQNQGIGTHLIRTIEKTMGAGRYELFTGARSTKNLYFYKKQGYTPFKTEKASEKVSLVYLEKRVGAKG